MICLQLIQLNLAYSTNNMRIVYIQSYPIYHDNVTDEAWMKIENRDKWMPGITAEKGAEVEIWVVGERANIRNYSFGNNSIPVRFFERSSSGKRTKFHFSRDLIEFARNNPVDHFVIKGLDGGVGVELLKRYIIPAKIPFSFVIGGEFRSKFNKLATHIFYESDRQFQQLIKKRWWILPGIPTNKLYKLPKSVNTDEFKPYPDIPKEFDVITMGRLIPYYKNYQAIIKLSSTFKVAVIGGGELLDEFRLEYPNIHWLGHINHADVPTYLSKGKVFFYSSTRDFFPRAIAEAVSCGLPVAAFGDSISDDVVQPNFGILLNKRNYEDQMTVLLSDDNQLTEMGKNARNYALKNWHLKSTESAVDTLLSNVGSSL